MAFLKATLLTLVSLAVLDGLWIGVFAKGFYKSTIGYLFGATPNWTAIVLFYLIYAAGVTFFVVAPALSAETSLIRTFLIGALLGLITYSAYNLTNQATIKDWPMVVTVVDLAWGTFMTGSAATIATLIARSI